MKEVQEFLKECGVYFLATTENNIPHVRPFGTAEIFEDKLYIQTGKKKDVSKQIANNPHVELCAYKDGKWLRVKGTLKRDDRIIAKQDMLDKNPELKGMYQAEDDNTEVLYFENAVATFYSFTEPPREIVL